jgi:uncharacterized repeat protein (TIGR03803 family)
MMSMRCVSDALRLGLAVVIIFLLGMSTATEAPAADAVTTLATLGNVNPSQLVEGPDGNYYGTTLSGGAPQPDELGPGTVFRVTPQGLYTTLHIFNFTDGLNPAGLLLAPDGNFYGSTQGGGSNGLGTVFKITPAGVFSVIYNFPVSGTAGLMGGGPTALALGADGNLYGISNQGGANTCGALFRLTLAGVPTVTYSFPEDGGSAQPGAPPMTLGADGFLYGVANEGFFRVSPLGSYSLIPQLNNTLNTNLGGTILLGSDGNIYGTKNQSGVDGSGTIYKLANGVYSTLYSFPASYPNGTASSALIEGKDGFFYGIANGGQGACHCGQIFKISPAGVFVPLYYFNGTSDFGYPSTPLVQGSDGYFYGGTPDSLYRFDPSAPPPAGITLALNTATIALGNFTTLSWSVMNGTACTASGAWNGAQALSGSLSITPTAVGQYTYTLSCTGMGGNASTSATLTVVPPASAAISVSPTTVDVGGSATLTWTGNGTCVGSGAWSQNVPSSGSQPVTAYIGGSLIYTLTCTGQGGFGSATAFATLMVNPLPTVTLSPSAPFVAPGQPITLTWSATNATACTASNAWSGARATGGSTTVTPTTLGNATYVITCTGIGGTASSSATVLVAYALPSVTLTATPTNLTAGESATLTWSASNATTCVATGAWSGTLATAGMQSVTPESAGPSNYELSCTGGGGTTSTSATVTVSVAVPTLVLTVSKSNIAVGQSAQLSWSTTNATSCTASGDWSGAMSTMGSQLVTPASVGDDTYALTCAGAGGTVTQSVNIAIVAAPASSKSGGGGIGLPEVFGLLGMSLLRWRRRAEC